MIFPVTQRKDGLAAMFQSAKKKQKTHPMSSESDRPKDAGGRQPLKTELNPGKTPNSQDSAKSHENKSLPCSHKPGEQFAEADNNHLKREHNWDLQEHSSSEAPTNSLKHQSPTKSPKRRKAKQGEALKHTPSLDSFWQP